MGKQLVRRATHKQFTHEEITKARKQYERMLAHLQLGCKKRKIQTRAIRFKRLMDLIIKHDIKVQNDKKASKEVKQSKQVKRRSITFKDEHPGKTLPVSTPNQPIAMSATQYLKKFCGLKNECDPNDVKKAIGKSKTEHVLSTNNTEVKEMDITVSNSKAGEVPRWVKAKKSY